MVEVGTPEGRVAYGPVKLADIDALLDAASPPAVTIPCASVILKKIPYLARQQRLTFHRCGVIDPVSVDDYRAHGAIAASSRAEARCRGHRRGGARFGLRGRVVPLPAGIKWNTVMLAKADQKYVVCNADEGDSGTFADRMMMEGDPFNLIEGMPSRPSRPVPPAVTSTCAPSTRRRLPP